MSLLFWTWLGSGWAQETVPAAPVTEEAPRKADATPPAAQPAEMPPGAEGTESSEEANPEATREETAEEPATEPEPPALPATSPEIQKQWRSIEVSDRFIGGAPQFGPWPDGWNPRTSGFSRIPQLDLVTETLAVPAAQDPMGPALGPARPPAADEPVETAGPEPLPPPTVVEEPAPAPVALHQAGPGPRGPAAGDPLQIADLPIRPGNPVLLFLVGILMLLISSLAERLRKGLGKEGILVSLSTLATAMGRFFAIPFLIMGAFSLLPSALYNVIPYMFVAIALALGWTTRDLLSDLFAGIVIFAEGRFSEGDRIGVAGQSGLVMSVGFRSTQIRTDDQTLVSIPNHEMAQHTVERQPVGLLQVRVELNIDPTLEKGEVRQTLLEFAHGSPFIASVGHPDAFDRGGGRWVIQAHLVEPRYREAFEGSLIELASRAYPPREG